MTKDYIKSGRKGAYPSNEDLTKRDEKVKWYNIINPLWWLKLMVAHYISIKLNSAINVSHQEAMQEWETSKQ